MRSFQFIRILSFKMGEIIDGKKIAEEIKKNLKEEVKALKEKIGSITLATILVGDDPASRIYVNMKSKACEEIGITSKVYHLPSDSSEKDVLSLIETLGRDHSINAILVQLPLPKHISLKKVMSKLPIDKDVDCFNPLNLGSLFFSEQDLAPCTPKGIMRMLAHHEINLEGKDVVIVNHSIVVGKPLALMFLANDATVQVCHVKTKNLKEKTKNADILVVAAGKPKLINAEMVKDGAIVIDVGINKLEKKIVGDVSFDEVKEKASLITPVPGGVGPMTIAMLLENTILLTKRQIEGMKNA